MSQSSAIAAAIDQLNELIGRWIAWLTLFMVLVTVVIVVLRYGFNIGFIWMQESVRFMYAAVFLLGAGYTLKHDGHVRVDMLYERMGLQRRAWVDLLGTLLFLFPVCFSVIYFSWDYVLNSWADFEGSIEERGLHAVYLLKTCIWLFAGLLILQGLATVIRTIHSLRSPGSNPK
ncbi:MAG: TRAP transporter small permease subunit [Rhodospirillales bacterium]|nr:TRAP transporter small permease subunit [Rhodospirillales bacterium]MXX23575.1 TRAP transporter small permease subunit [Rhodospirillales bacterium]MYE20681.1 TRAP transporter small permease subunit [Rhodospirillales bacterium]